MKEIKHVLTIAGSDSSAGAGIQADIKSVTACGAYCSTAITAITAQNTCGVKCVEIISPAIVKAQIDAVLSDLGTDVIKIGMLPTKEIVDVVIESIKKYNIKKVILDPVMVSTSGHTLVDNDTAQHIINNLLPLVTLVTPNIPESEFITGETINSTDTFDSIARDIFKLGAKNILLKAGHIEGKELTDMLYEGDTNTKSYFNYTKIDTKNTHGTGCSLSSSISAFLANGFSIKEAVKKAEEYLHDAISSANYKIGEGHGPINHFYYLDKQIELWLRR